DLKPLLEIRWQSGASGESVHNFEKIAAKLCRGGGFAPSSLDSGQFGDDLPKRFHIKRFDSGRSPSESVLLLSCSTCAAAVLVKIYQAFREKPAAHSYVLDSLRCHADDRQQQKWQIQDFYFYVPDGFELKSASFRLGLANLFFTSKASELTLFRLAAAAQHLQDISLAELFASLCSAPPADQSDQGLSTLHYHYAPGPVEKIWSALRRKKPYRAAALTHFLHRDRILGYNISSRRPIGDGMQSAIENGYGIIQEEDGCADTDQGSGADLHSGQK
ncbi:MAG: hypothetical protein P8X39_00935, partial [Desulfofustis sp.]